MFNLKFYHPASESDCQRITSRRPAWNHYSIAWNAVSEPRHFYIYLATVNRVILCSFEIAQCHELSDLCCRITDQDPRPANV